MRDTRLPCLKWCDVGESNVTIESLRLFLDVRAFPVLEEIDAKVLPKGAYNLKQKRELVTALRERGVELRMTKIQG